MIQHFLGNMRFQVSINCGNTIRKFHFFWFICIWQPWMCRQTIWVAASSWWVSRANQVKNMGSCKRVLTQSRHSGQYSIQDDPLSQLSVPGARQGQPDGRRVHQRSPPAQPCETEDHRDGRGRSSPVCDQSSAEGEPRVRVEDPEQVPGDREHQARHDRRQ